MSVTHKSYVSHLAPEPFVLSPLTEDEDEDEHDKKSPRLPDRLSRDRPQILMVL